MNRGILRGGRRLLPGLAAVAGAAMLSACAVTPQPLTSQEQQSAIKAFRQALASQAPITRPISLYEAEARALRYNFTSRLKEMEREIAQNRADASVWAMLPKLNADGAAMGRDKVLAESSQLINGQPFTPAPATSQDKRFLTSDLRMSWNILDFGVSYFSARQAANQTLIAQQRRRKVVQQLVNDVRDAYWRAVAADRLLKRVDKVLGKIRLATHRTDQILQRRAAKPLRLLNYQRDLYTKLLQLESLRRSLVSSKMELAKLMNLAPGQEFHVVIPRRLPRPPSIAIPASRLEDIALHDRPELIEENYQARIAADEVRKSIARMFPGIELSISKNYDSNSFLLYNQWEQAGLQVTWNLMNLLSGWDDIDHAKMQKKLSAVRRNLLSVAVLTQVNVAYLDYREAREAYGTAAKIHGIDVRIERDKEHEASSRNLGELDLIQTQLNTLLSQLKEDEQYGQVQSALGRLAMSVGDDPFSGVNQNADVATLTTLLAKKDHAWIHGPWFRRAVPTS